ncbi:carbohydrate sulfotransferase 9-like [Antedon mediterranea]|uniref:carbohydrate sulfotransferase 9-like n=1 Tax=Antedon mediterranea TaxID=105859 RepID=UPI003AF41DF5
MRQKVFGVLLFVVIGCSYIYEWKIGGVSDWMVYYRSQIQNATRVVNQSRNLFMEVQQSDDDRIRQRFENRRKHIKELCSHELYREALSLQNIFVEDKFKIMYCSIPKTGCTNWKRLFLVLRGLFRSTSDIQQTAVHTPKFHTTLKSKTRDEIATILKTYKKFMILREPFSRILSAYRNKFEENNRMSILLRNSFVPKIIRKYRTKPEQTKGIKSVTFREFINYLADTSNGLLTDPEEHWREAYRLCYPCEIDYDYYGHFETLTEDSTYIIKALNLSIEYPQSTNPTNSSETSILEEYYSQISSGEIEKLKDRYRIDMLLFDTV